MKTRSSIATKVAVVVSAVVVAALALTGGLAIRSTDQALVELQLNEATRRLETNLAITERILAERFPGEWELAPVEGAASITLFNGNSRDPRWEVRETLEATLLKGGEPVGGNPEVEAMLVEIARLTGTRLAIAQRLPPRLSGDPQVAGGPVGRALRLVAADVNDEVAVPDTLAVGTMMPDIDPVTKEAAAAGRVLAEGEEVIGRSVVTGADNWTIYRPLRDAQGQVVGVIYAGMPFAPFAARAAQASREVARGVLPITALVALGASLLLFMLTRALLRPLRAVHVALAKLGEGEWPERLPVRTRDEAGALADAFNRLAADLREI